MGDKKLPQEKSLDEQYVEVFGTHIIMEVYDDTSSLIQPGLGEVVESFASSYSIGGPKRDAKLESDSYRNN